MRYNYIAINKIKKYQKPKKIPKRYQNYKKVSETKKIAKRYQIINAT